ncbi:MAG: hypothetical protein ACPGVV_00560 [Croceimicrobium sp.]
MKNLLYTFSLALLGFLGQAQNVELTGRIIGAEEAGLEMANVLVLDAKDSSMVTYGFTNSAGQFRFKVEANKSVILKMSYLGYQPKELLIKLNEEDRDLGKIPLVEDNELLNQVEIVEEMPIMISGDTISYKADAFTNGEEQKLENILEKLPGFEVDDDGQVTVEGKPVEKVLVEGKEFFDGDTKVATKNIPADAIDKVQVLRNYEEISPLQGLSSDDRVALNIKLKEGKKNLWFGDAEAKVGDPSRYYAHSNAFYYSPKASFNFIGDVNNIGRSAFTARDYFRFSGGLRRLSSRSGFNFNFAQDDLGIPLGQNNRADEVIGRFGAANFSYNPRKDLTLSGFVIGSNNDVTSPYTTTRTYIGLDSTGTSGVEQLVTENQQQATAALAKFSATYEPSEGMYFNYDIFLKISDQTNIQNLYSTFSDFGFSNNLASQETKRPWSFDQSLEFFKNIGDDVFAVELQHQRKFQDPIFAMQSQQQPFLFPFVFSDTNSYDIVQTREVFSESIEGRTSYYWVLNGNNHFEFNAGSVYNTQDYSNRLAEGSVSDASEFNDPNLQNDVDFALLDGFAGMHYKTKIGKLTFRPGFNYHYYQVRDQQAGTEDLRDFQALLPDALLSYEFSSSKNLDLRYNMSAQFNDVNQIMDGIILRSYNSLFTGNDSLDFARIHNVSLFYRDFNLFNFTTIFGGVNYSRSLDPINNAVQYFGFQQVFNPINAVGYNENISAFGSWSKKWKWIRLDSRVNLSYNTVENEVNDRVNTNNTFTQNYRAEFGTNFNKYPNIELRYSFSQNDYSGAANNQVFTNHSPRLELSYVFFSDFVWRADYSYNNYGNPGGIRTVYDFLNSSLEYRKQDSKWVFSLEGLNLLNTTFIREDGLSANLISTTSYNVLPRYVLLGVRYDL